VVLFDQTTLKIVATAAAAELDSTEPNPVKEPTQVQRLAAAAAALEAGLDDALAAAGDAV